MPRKTDSHNPADWLYIAPSDLDVVRLAAEREAPFGAARSKRAQVLEKILKAELLRLGWRLEQTHDLNRLLQSLVERHLKHEPVTARPPSMVYLARKFMRRNRVLVTQVTMAVCLAALAAAGAFLWLRHTRVQWAKNEAVPEVERLVEQAALTWDYSKNRQALQLGQKASRYLPSDPQLQKVLDTCSGLWSIRSDPPAARVVIKPYGDPNAN